MKHLFTIGYEGTDLDAFLATLKRAKVNVLLDIRELPISRRNGFSKNVLREALEACGIEYRHEKRLGSPRTIRHRLREDGNYQRFFTAYEKHLAHHSELLEALCEELNGNVALMCYERDHTQCHRSTVCSVIAGWLDLTPQHLQTA